ncbi:hypothetical protein [Mesobacillus stamsii]|uniref:Uncharacterized protein n=1 Tax=Mesobacillus stamsii TaxID=225347 RepID=A0ABU0FQX5_9BACI|nr:hypothetical protein [Mesobacillus stamsii]MDQ0412312.1 hypothetical protein [Mesobacillus stamsii]
MDKVKKVAELFDLVQYYYEYRDQPMKENMNFFAEVEDCCRVLDLDFEELKREFKLDF